MSHRHIIACDNCGYESLVSSELSQSPPEWGGFYFTYHDNSPCRLYENLCTKCVQAVAAALKILEKKKP